MNEGQRFPRVSGALTVANAGVAMASRHDDLGESRVRDGKRRRRTERGRDRARRGRRRRRELPAMLVSCRPCSTTGRQRRDNRPGRWTRRVEKLASRNSSIAWARVAAATAAEFIMSHYRTTSPRRARAPHTFPYTP